MSWIEVAKRKEVFSKIINQTQKALMGKDEKTDKNNNGNAELTKIYDNETEQLLMEYMDEDENGVCETRVVYDDNGQKLEVSKKDNSNGRTLESTKYVDGKEAYKSYYKYNEKGEPEITTYDLSNFFDKVASDIRSHFQ